MDGLRAFELRLTTLDGVIKHIPITTTDTDASALARRYLDHGQAIRVDVWGWRYHRWELDGVIETPKPPAEPEPDPDALPVPEDDVVEVDDEVLDVDDE
jgi:hypothetical protein